MPISRIEAETLALMEEACDQAWRILEANTPSVSPAEAQKIHLHMSSRVMASVADGERNPEELTIIALNLRQE